MTTAETDLNKPSGIVCRTKTVGIIHPKRFVNVKSKSWTKIFGKRAGVIDVGDISQAPTQEDIDTYITNKNITILGLR